MGIKKLMIDCFQFSHLAEWLVAKMLSRVVGLSASGLLGLRTRSVLKTGLEASKWPLAFQRFRNQLVGGKLN